MHLKQSLGMFTCITSLLGFGICLTNAPSLIRPSSQPSRAAPMTVHRRSTMFPLLLRNHLLRVSSRRHFHSSPRPQFLETTLTATHTLLTTLHTTSALPWAALIPLSAIILRLTITAPLAVFSRQRALKIISLQPLIAAWQHPLARAAKKSTSSPQAWELATKKSIRAKRKEIWKRHGCSMWKIFVAPAIQLPVWIAASVTLRGMTGRDGLPEWLQRVGSTTATGGNGGEGIGEEVVGMVKERIVPLEASLADEGALWFPNLLEEDPLMILPLAFSFLMFANIEMQSLHIPASARTQRIITNALRIVSVVAIPVIIYQPAALTLYWTTSAAFSLVQNRVLEKAMPRPEELTPCKPADPYQIRKHPKEEEKAI